MLTHEATAEMIEEWERVFKAHRQSLLPNRKSGIDVDSYFRGKYQYNTLSSPKFEEVVKLGILENEYSKDKLNGQLPLIRSYTVGDVMIGIDLVSGEFHVESENIEEMAKIYDDLFAFRGLDEEDIENFCLVAEYVRLTLQ